MTWTYDILALAVAASWALGSTLSVAPSRRLGAIAFSRWRMLLVAAMMWAATLLGAGRAGIGATQLWPLLLSGVVGIFIGDSANFAALNRLGPRRTGVLFATHAVFSAGLGFLLFDERMSLQALSGAVMAMVGIVVAIGFGQRTDESHKWEATHDRLRTGVLLGLTAGLSQSVGTLLAKPAMAAGINPVEASAIRVSAACVAHFGLLAVAPSVAAARTPIDRRVLAQTGLSGFVGMGVGMTLLLLALRHGDVGMVAILSSVTPVFVLPVLWVAFKRAPAPGAWLGALLTVAGTALILSR